MKKITLIMAFVSTILIIGCGPTISPEEKAKNEKIKREELSKLFKLLDNEKQVIEYIFTDANFLYLSVEDNGSNRNGLASYFCQLTYEFKNIDVAMVRIVAPNTTKHPNRDNAYGVWIGESFCDD